MTPSEPPDSEDSLTAGQHLTLVVCVPPDGVERQLFDLALDAFGLFLRGYSTEDEMSVLTMIEAHEDFDPLIASEARAKMREMYEGT